MSARLNLLQKWYKGESVTTTELQQLWEWEQKDSDYVRAFDLTEDSLKWRTQFFIDFAPEIVDFCQQQGFQSTPEILHQLWRVWLPFALQLAEIKQSFDRALIQGILGGQGTGKTTLAAITRLILDFLGYSSVSISIDDLYKTYAERQQLLEQDSRLIWRGPPGTHDVELGIRVLDQFLVADPDSKIAVPRFDKSLHNGAGDRISPELVKPVDIVFFEGWFVGVQPVDQKAFDSPPHPITTQADCSFARDSNQRLQAYLPLWQRLDRLIVLYPVDYRLSKQWRQEAESKMIAQGKTGMSRAEIERFVQYFWCALHPELFVTPLTNNPNIADLVIQINPDRSIGAIYRPTDKESKLKP